MKATSESVRVRVSVFVAAVALSTLPTNSFGLAETNDFYGLPAGLANDVVRIGTTANFDFAFGSGTIISTVPDGSGGAWYNVLTADHVLYNAYNVGTNGGIFVISMGFRFNQSLPLSVASTNNIALDGANGPGGNGPDLALFAIDVTAAEMSQTNVIGTTGLLPVTFTTPYNGTNNLIVQAGYGNKGLAGNGPPAAAGVNRYLTTTNGVDVYDAGANTIPTNGAAVGGLVANYNTGVTNSRGGTYKYDAIRGTFAFTTNNSGTVLSGTTYLEEGDSGGPTFGTNGSGGFSLIGVHSVSQFSTSSTSNGGVITTQQWATAGISAWSDVQVSSYYANWIATEIPLIDVPEPSSLAMAGAGLLLLASFWNRARRRRAVGTDEHS